MQRNQAAGWMDTADRENGDLGLICQIRTKFESMPKSFKCIARYMIDNSSMIPGITITQFAKKIGTTPATITRFCQSMGFSGFPELRFCLDKGVLNSVFEEEQIVANDPIPSIKKKMRQKYMQAIDESIALISDQSLQYAAEKIVAADKLIFFGHGGSGVAAQYGQVSFMQIGITCHCFTDTSMAHMAAAQLGKNDVAVGISYSGKSNTAVDSLRTAKENGATTISVTGYANSIINRHADIPFCFNAKLADDLRNLPIARMCETAIIGLLHICVLSHNYEKLQKGMQISKEAFIKGRYPG